MINVYWHSMMFGFGGYSEINRNLVLELVKYKDIRLELAPIKTSYVDNPTQQKLLPLLQNKIPPQLPAINVVCMIPSFFRIRRPGICVGYTMFEAKTIPLRFAEECNLVQEVWVPNTFNIEAFQRGGVKVPIHYMPFGIDTDRWQDRTALPIPGAKGFKFCAVSNWDPRKGLDLLVKAFIEEFSGDEDVCLILKSSYHYRADKASREFVDIQLNKLAAASNKKNPPKIISLCDALGTLQIPQLYRAIDCLVQPTHGEGFFLPAFEAAMCNVPTIVTDFGGHTDALNSDNSYLIRVEKFAECPDLSRVSRYYGGQQWAHPDMTHCKQLMRHVFENREELAQKGKRVQQDVLAKWTIQQSVSRIYNRLRELSSLAPIVVNPRRIVLPVL